MDDAPLRIAAYLPMTQEVADDLAGLPTIGQVLRGEVELDPNWVDPEEDAAILVDLFCRLLPNAEQDALDQGYLELGEAHLTLSDAEADAVRRALAG